MHSANKQDIEEFRKTGVLREDVMYSAEDGLYLVHGKEHSFLVESAIYEYRRSGILAETDKGCLVLVDKSSIQAIPKKGPAQQPKRPRRKPIKGTRPEKKIPFDEYIAKYGKLKVGDTVLVHWEDPENWGCPSARQKVVESDGTARHYRLHEAGWFYESGGAYFPDGTHITHVIIPYLGVPDATPFLPLRSTRNKMSGVVEAEEEEPIQFEIGNNVYTLEEAARKAIVQLIREEVEKAFRERAGK